MLKDHRRIEKDYGMHETYSFYRKFMEIEQYTDFLYHQIMGVALSLLAVILVVTFITMNFQVTMLVVSAVILVDFYLVALAHFWGLTMN